MRKSLLVIAALLLSLTSAFAEKVTQERAAAAAQAFFTQPGFKYASGMKMVSLAAEAPGENPAYRAYNRTGGGFVVIAGNDAVEPVLAYSDEGEFPCIEDMPENMAWWFKMLEMQINSIPEGAEATDQIERRWIVPQIVKSLPESLNYDTAIWNQNAPFNNMCPTHGSTHCLTGCEATAAGIIAYYFKWPDAGVGTVAASNNQGEPYQAHALGHAYDYNNMLKSYNSGYNTTQANAVATLLYDMGTAFQMEYGTGGSGTKSSRVLEGFKNHMKYSKRAYIAKRNDYSDEKWFDLVKHTLNECGPTIYAGDNPDGNGGHAFVIDGYDASGRFHFNWGWGGQGNCYCYLATLVPNGINDNYSKNQEMMVNLVPDRDGTSQPEDYLIYRLNGSHTGLRANVTSFVKDGNFKCTATLIQPKIVAFNGTFYVSLYDKDGNFKQDVSKGTNLQIPLNAGSGFQNASCKITVDIAPGDKLMVRYVGQYNEGIIDAGEGCTTEIVVRSEDDDPASAYSAAQNAAGTKLSYNKQTKVLTLEPSYPVYWTIKNSSSEQVDGGYKETVGKIEINTSDYASGQYFISIGSKKNPYTFTFTK
ncbi:MAG: C10 family peptidase [Bacteroidales bacterium]|nr:C10 family peptidase [Bacteroidales bacterium]